MSRNAYTAYLSSSSLYTLDKPLYKSCLINSSSNRSRPFASSTSCYVHTIQRLIDSLLMVPISSSLSSEASPSSVCPQLSNRARQTKKTIRKNTTVTTETKWLSHFKYLNFVCLLLFVIRVAIEMFGYLKRRS